MKKTAKHSTRTARVVFDCDSHKPVAVVIYENGRFVAVYAVKKAK